MGELADKVKERSPFLRLEDGESIIATYKGYKMIPSSYDPEKEVFRFMLEIEVEGEKQAKYWDTGANKVALVFDPLKPGDQVRITKNVDNPGTTKEKTNWQVEVLGAESEPKEEVSKEKTEEESSDFEQESMEDLVS